MKPMIGKLQPFLFNSLRGFGYTILIRSEYDSVGQSSICDISGRTIT